MSKSRSLEAAAKKAKGALLIGGGGGGDVIQALPMMNYLRTLGLKNVVVANIGIAWWEGLPGLLSWGGDWYELSELTNSKMLGENATRVSAKTTLASGPGKGQQPWEAVLAGKYDFPTYTIGLNNGTQGIADGLRMIAAKHGLDLVIAVDNGSDSFYSGNETAIDSPLVDAMVMSAILQTELDAFYVLSGYACDAEMTVNQLNRNVAIVMKNGGYLGAHGLTPEDIELMDPIFKPLPDDLLLKWSYMAAHGAIGSFSTRANYPIEITPLTAVMLFFDPKVIVEHLNPLPNIVKNAKSLEEAEKLINARGLVSETQRPLFIPSKRD
jgi:hypothetical protein